MRFDANMSDNDDDDVICRESIRPRKIKPQNIVCRLIERERGAQRPGTHVHAIREFYKNIYPNLTIINVEKPAGFLRKFSPDGKYLIAFTFDQTSLEIYRFNGVVAAAELINVWKTEVVPNSNTDLPYGIRSQIFDKLFKVIQASPVECPLPVTDLVLPLLSLLFIFFFFSWNRLWVWPRRASSWIVNAASLPMTVGMLLLVPLPTLWTTIAHHSTICTQATMASRQH